MYFTIGTLNLVSTYPPLAQSNEEILARKKGQAASLLLIYSIVRSEAPYKLRLYLIGVSQSSYVALSRSRMQSHHQSLK